MSAPSVGEQTQDPSPTTLSQQNPCPAETPVWGATSLPTGTCIRAGPGRGGMLPPSWPCLLLVGEVESTPLKLDSGILRAPASASAWREEGCFQKARPEGCQLTPSPGLTSPDLLTPSPAIGSWLKAPWLGLMASIDQRYFQKARAPPPPSYPPLPLGFHCLPHLSLFSILPLSWPFPFPGPQ